MFKQSKSLIYLSISIFSLALLQSSCKKKDVFPSQQLPEITSMSPSSAIAGAPVVLKGINLKNVDAVRFGTAMAAHFDSTANTDTAIHINVPDSLPLGDLYVQVYLKDGKGYSAFKFTVLLTPPVPKIDSVSPAKALPGATVIISGNNFSLVNSVQFGGIKASFGPTLDTNHRIQAIVPLGATAGNQFITVSNTNGVDSIPFTVDFSPVVTSFSPQKTTAGNIDTVYGVRFTGATSVLIDTITTNYTVLNDSMISFTVPAGAFTGPVTVTTAYGTGVSSNSLVVLVAGFKLVIYDDIVEPASGFSTWGGWGGTANYANTSPVESGTNSIAVHYVGGYGSPIQLGGATIDLTKYTTFKISIYGGPGTNGKQVNIGFNSVNDPTNYNTTDGKTIVIVEGQWTDFEIPISDIISSTHITILDQIILKEYSNATDEMIYVDNIGLN